jgi:hypothetical protein
VVRQDCAGVTSCHGYCINLLECTQTEVLTEYDFVLTVLDWQNAVFLVMIVAMMGVGKVVFMRLYQLHLAATSALEFKKSSAQLSGVSAVDNETGPVLSRARSTTEEFGEQMAKLSPSRWWHQATKEPAVLICLAAFYFSTSGVVSASLSEFEVPDRVYQHVGWDTQTEKLGVEARLQNIGNGVFWALLGLIFMVVAQLVVRCFMFSGMKEDLVALVTEGATGDDADQAGSNVAAAIVESGCVIASGLVAAGACSGEPTEDLGLDVGAAVAFFVLSQLLFVLYMRLFDALYIHGTVEEALRLPLTEEQWVHLPHGQIGEW